MSTILGLLAGGLMAAWLGTTLYRYWRLVNFRREVRQEAESFLAEGKRTGQLDFPPPWLRDGLEPRGVVLCAGGASLLAQAYTTLDVLRNHHGCELPIALYFAGEAEMSERCRRFFEESFDGLRCIDATALPDRPLHRRATALSGFPLKPFAFLNAPFEELLYLDADCAPIREPSFLFDDPSYREHGNLFWSDNAMIHTSVDHPGPWSDFSLKDGQTRNTLQSLNPRIFDYLGLPRPSTPERASYETEAGQLLLDRRVCFASVQMAWFINSRARLFYLYLHGDKDTYRLGFGLAGQAFSQLQVRSHQAGWIEDGHFVGKALVQRDARGDPLFLHQTHRKPDQGAWRSLTHLVEDAAVDHPRPRHQRRASSWARVEELSSIKPVDGEIRELDEFIRISRETLSRQLTAADLPTPPPKRWLRRRIVPW